MSGHVLIIALGNSLLWSVYLLLTRHVVSGAQLDAWAYTLVQLLSAGLAMLWIGRRTPGSWADLLVPWTVCYAFMRVIINGCTAARPAAKPLRRTLRVARGLSVCGSSPPFHRCAEPGQRGGPPATPQ